MKIFVQKMEVEDFSNIFSFLSGNWFLNQSNLRYVTFRNTQAILNLPYEESHFLGNFLSSYLWKFIQSWPDLKFRTYEIFLTTDHANSIDIPN